MVPGIMDCEEISNEEWAILQQIEIALESIADYQNILEGEYWVVGSIAMLSVYQTRKYHMEVREYDNDLNFMVQPVMAFLKDFDECYNSSRDDGKVKYSNLAVTSFRNCYVRVHHYLFSLSYLILTLNQLSRTR